MYPRLNRDSALLWLMACAAALGYLATMPPPMEWTYQQWIGTGLAASMWGIGKLQNSPLGSSKDWF
jgi:hypothetical protein